MAYTVNAYTMPTGARKNQATVNLRIQYAVILHEPDTESNREVSEDQGN
jgi:hypothetical protein